MTPLAEEYYRQLEQRRVNARHHVRKIVALSEIHGVEAVANAVLKLPKSGGLKVDILPLAMIHGPFEYNYSYLLLPSD